MSVSRAANRMLDAGQTVEAGSFAAGLRRRWRWIFWPTLIAALGSSAFVMLAPPRYTAVANVLLEDLRSDDAQSGNEGGVESEAIDLETAQSRAVAAASPDLARRVVERLGLATNEEFNPTDAGSTDGRIDQRIIDKFLSRLTVIRAPRSRVLQIEFVSRDPDIAARGANMAAQVFVQSQTDAKARAERTAGEQLSRKVEELRGKVADADAKVEAFRAESGLIAGANGQTASGQQRDDLNAQLATARAAESSAETKIDLLRRLERDGRLDEAPAAIADDPLRRLSDQRATLKAQIAEASRTLLPLHPQMKELNAQLAGIDAEMREAAARNARLLENEARLASDQVATLSAAMAQQSKTAATGDANDARLRELAMDAKAARDQLETYLQKSREAAAREADSAAPSGARLIAAAEPPRAPAFPKGWQTVLIASLAAFVCAFGVAAAATLASDEANPEPNSAPQRLPARSLDSRPEQPPAQSASEPQEAAAAPDPAFGVPPRAFDPRGALAVGTMNAADDLASRLMRFKVSERSLTVLIAAVGSGRALALALETARSLSKLGPALLVDLGATQDWFPDILDREGSDETEIAGLKDLLEGRASYAEAIRRDISSTLDVIPLGGPVSGEGLQDIFAALASAYSCVVLHASDWRSPVARAAAEASDVAVVAAPAAKLPRAIGDATAALGDACSQILAHAEKGALPVLEDEAA